VLSRSRSRNGAGEGLGASSTTPYSHLIGGAAAGLKLSTCVYFDGLDASKVSMHALLDLVDQWFTSRGCRPKVLLIKDRITEKHPRYSMKKLREVAGDEATIARMAYIQFFPKGRTTIDDTWRPSVYVALSMERPTAAFFCFNGTFSVDEAQRHLLRGQGVFASCAAYAFAFPERFSPLAYFDRISVQPAGRDVGAWADRESDRLVNFRDNSTIGVTIDNQRRWFSACDGYVRDVYPLMLLSAKHMDRAVGTRKLRDAVRDHDLGSIIPQTDRYLWRIPTDKLAQAQILLDDHDITLSGRRFAPRVFT